MSDFLTPQQLEEKWSPILDHADLPKIADTHRRFTTAVLLENQEKAIREEKQTLMEAGLPSSNVGGAAGYDPVLIGLVRRSMPQLIAYDICGVQPMTMPTGLVFSLKSRYTSMSGTEALFNEADAGFSGATGQTQAGNSPVESTNGASPWDASAGFTRGAAMTSASVAEQINPQSMSFSIEKFSVTAKSRALKADYSVELAQDLKAVHGLDAEGELSNILSNEILAEINREVVRNIYYTAKPGAQLATTAGTFDLDVDANGRWSVERFKGLLFQIEREANLIGQQTRRGRGNFLLCSADVASALAMTGQLDYTPALAANANMNIDDTSTTFAGTLNGKYKVYIDPYMGNGTTDQFCMVGYRGKSPFDAGMFYCPYVPLSLMRAVDPDTFQPKIGFKTRYALASHPFAGANTATTGTISASDNTYFRLFKIANLA